MFDKNCVPVTHAEEKFQFLYSLNSFWFPTSSSEWARSRIGKKFIREELLNFEETLVLFVMCVYCIYTSVAYTYEEKQQKQYWILLTKQIIIVNGKNGNWCDARDTWNWYWGKCFSLESLKYLLPLTHQLPAEHLIFQVLKLKQFLMNFVNIIGRQCGVK